MVSFDADRFIVEVEQRPAIWDSRCDEYSNKLSRGRAWEELCDIFVPDFNEMDSLRKNKAAVDLQRKWKSFRDSFRRELAKVKKAKSNSAADTGRKEYMYFKQLFFLLPICETKYQEEGSFEGPAEGKGADQDQSSPLPTLQDRKRKPPASEERLPQTSSALTANRRAREPPPLSARQKRRKTVGSEGQLLRALAKSMERKELDDPDRHFLLSLLPHLKNIPEEVKLSVKGEFINILKRFRQQAAFANHFCPSGLPSQSFPLQHNAGPPSAEPQQTLNPNIQCSHTNPQHSTSAGAPSLTRLRPIRTHSPTPDSPAVSEAISPRSDGSSICDDYFL